MVHMPTTRRRRPHPPLRSMRPHRHARAPPASDDEKRLLWAAREALVGEPRALPKVLLAVDWSVKSQVREAYRLLGKWAPLPPLHALQLLSKRFPDAKVRAFAVRCLEPLGDADLARAQLAGQGRPVVCCARSHHHRGEAPRRRHDDVESGINTPHFPTKAAQRLHRGKPQVLLLRRALRSPLVCGHALYWALAAEIDKETHSCRAVWKSKFYGVFVLNLRVSSTPSTRRLLDGVGMPVPHSSAEPGRSHRRREMTPDSLVDFHTGVESCTTPFARCCGAPREARAPGACW